MRAAARRFGLLFVSAAAVSAVAGLVLGLIVGEVSRGVALGWYLGGSALLLGGFFVGNRGPSRPRGEGGAPSPSSGGCAGRPRRSSRSRSTSLRS